MHLNYCFWKKFCVIRAVIICKNLYCYHSIFVSQPSNRMNHDLSYFLIVFRKELVSDSDVISLIVMLMKVSLDKSLIK